MKSTLSLQAVEEKHGISQSMLRLCIAKDLPGCNQNYTVNLKKFLPYWNEHKAELEAELSQSIEELKKEKLRGEIRLDNLKERQMSRNLIEPDDVVSFLSTFGIKLTVSTNKKRQSLKSKCIGYEKVIDNEFLDLIKEIKDELAKWE